MTELADGFIAMPGGFGTLEELTEILTWIQLGLVQKPVGLLNVDHFFDNLILQLDMMVEQGLLRHQNREILLVDPNPQNLVALALGCFHHHVEQGENGVAVFELVDEGQRAVRHVVFEEFGRRQEMVETGPVIQVLEGVDYR